MKRNEFDESIICNENMDEPSKTVLDAAKEEMRKNNAVKKKLSPSKIWAIATSCVAALVILCCIPLMLPKDGYDYAAFAIFPSTDGMSQSEISSIEDFNKNNDNNVLTFDNAVANESYIYQDQDKIVYCRELYTYGDTQIEMWVALNETQLIPPASDDGNLSNSESNCNVEGINGCRVEYVVDKDNRVFAKFRRNGYVYMIEMKGDISTWKNILENFIK